MTLSRLLGYYCLLMLLCSTLFARWLPPSVCPSDTPDVVAQTERPSPRPRLLRVSLRVAPSVMLPVSR